MAVYTLASVHSEAETVMAALRWGLIIFGIFGFWYVISRPIGLVAWLVRVTPLYHVLAVAVRLVVTAGALLGALLLVESFTRETENGMNFGGTLTKINFAEKLNLPNLFFYEFWNDLYAEKMTCLIACTIFMVWGWFNYAAAAARWRQKQEERRTGLCRNCGYDLRGISARCPECGRSTATLTGDLHGISSARV